MLVICATAVSTSYGSAGIKNSSTTRNENEESIVFEQITHYNPGVFYLSTPSLELTCRIETVTLIKKEQRIEGTEKCFYTNKDGNFPCANTSTFKDPGRNYLSFLRLKRQYLTEQTPTTSQQQQQPPSEKKADL